MNKTLPLKDAESIENIVSVLTALVSLDGKRHVVHIKPSTTLLSDKQRKLYWKWLTVIGTDLGDSKDYYHEYYKNKFLVSIYERDNDSYREMMVALRDVYRSGQEANAIKLKNMIVEMTSIVNATTKQMAEYMSDIEIDVSHLGITLPIPDSRNILEYKEAQGW